MTDQTASETRKAGRPAGTGTGEGETLTRKLKALCDEYVVDWHITKAAIRAGYPGKTARIAGSRDLKRPAAVRYLAELERDLAVERNALRQLVIDELLKVAQFNYDDIKYDPDDLTYPIPEHGEIVAGIDLRKCNRDHMAAIASVKVSTTGVVTITFSDKMRALDMLGKHAGLFVDKLELTGADGGAVAIDNGMSPIEAAAAWKATLEDDS